MDAAGVPAADADGNCAVYAAESAAIKGLPQELLRQCAYEYTEKDIQALCSIIRTWVKAAYGKRLLRRGICVRDAGED